MFVDKIFTVSKWKLFLRLCLYLPSIPNTELRRRLKHRALHYQRGLSSWLEAISNRLMALVLPYWVVAGPVEWYRVWKLVSELADQEMSVDFLVYRVSCLTNPVLKESDILILISSREIVQALVEDRQKAMKIAEVYNIERGEKR